MISARYLSQKDASILSSIAEGLLRIRDTRYNPAEEILDLISSATLLPDGEERPDCMSLYSTATYKEGGLLEERSLTIVFPHEANEAFGRVSLLAPLSLALIGQVKGSLIEVPLPFGQLKLVKLIDVHKPVAVLHA